MDTRHILVTSFKGGVGKTTLAANLAAALSYLDALGEVLIVDGDTRGDVRNCLGDLTEPVDALFEWMDGGPRRIYGTGYENLFLLPGATKTARLGMLGLTEGLTPDRVADKIQAIDEEYSYVVWDVPANIPVLFPAVTHVADLVVIVTKLDDLGLADIRSVLRQAGTGRSIIVPNITEMHTGMHRENLDAIHRAFSVAGSTVPIGPLVPKSEDVKRYTRLRVPLAYVDTALSDTGLRAKGAYLELGEIAMNAVGVTA